MPVEEMAAKFLQLVEAHEREFQPLKQLSKTDIAKTARRQSRQQKQSDVGRRSAMRNHLRVFLKIVRRQPVVFVRYERLKETPGTSRHNSGRPHVMSAERRVTLHAPATDIRSEEHT